MQITICGKFKSSGMLCKKVYQEFVGYMQIVFGSDLFLISHKLVLDIKDVICIFCKGFLSLQTLD
jgi:hypothetical protein